MATAATAPGTGNGPLAAAPRVPRPPNAGHGPRAGHPVRPGGPRDHRHGVWHEAAGEKAEVGALGVVVVSSSPPPTIRCLGLSQITFCPFNLIFPDCPSTEDGAWGCHMSQKRVLAHGGDAKVIWYRRCNTYHYTIKQALKGSFPPIARWPPFLSSPVCLLRKLAFPLLLSPSWLSDMPSFCPPGKLAPNSAAPQFAPMEAAFVDVGAANCSLPWGGGKCIN